MEFAWTSAENPRFCQLAGAMAATNKFPFVGSRKHPGTSSNQMFLACFRTNIFSDNSFLGLSVGSSNGFEVSTLFRHCMALQGGENTPQIEDSGAGNHRNLGSSRCWNDRPTSLLFSHRRTMDNIDMH